MVSNNLMNNASPEEANETQNAETRDGATDAAGAVAGYPSTLALDQNLHLL